MYLLGAAVAATRVFDHLGLHHQSGRVAAAQPLGGPRSVPWCRGEVNVLCGAQMSVSMTSRRAYCNCIRDMI